MDDNDRPQSGGAVMQRTLGPIGQIGWLLVVLAMFGVVLLLNLGFLLLMIGAAILLSALMGWGWEDQFITGDPPLSWPSVAVMVALMLSSAVVLLSHPAATLVRRFRNRPSRR